MKWMVCVPCGRIFKNEKKYLVKHPGHRPIRYAHNEPWYYIFQQPELLIDWLKLKYGSLSDYLRTKGRTKTAS